MIPEKPDLSQVKLPQLNPTIRLYQGPDHDDGTPRWVLHHPLSNQYFRIGWMEFECLSRFGDHVTARELQDAVNQETTLDLDDDDILGLIAFLNKNGLLTGRDAMTGEYEAPKKKPFLSTVVHSYLFFTLPLFKPERFLKATWPWIRPLFSTTFTRLSFILLLLMVLATIQRADEFFASFFQLFTLDGIIGLFLTFSVIKIFHEFGHAYTAHRYGIPVPHMGIAFMVLYPVLYTETTASWRIASTRSRIRIGLAGVGTELVIAAYALVLWHVLPPGPMQNLVFNVIAISLVGSLLVNLNPLMRFDGYFVLSDALKIENLHARGFAYARWAIRRVLFALNDPPPGDENAGRRRFLIWFGLATLIYRFFLFLGIAILVYIVFFKPLGLILMIIELLWFIGLPVWSEIKVWIERRGDIAQQRRFVLLAAGLVVVALLFILPVNQTIHAPAIAHASLYRAHYPPAPAIIEKIAVKDGQTVHEGDVLIVLSSPVLDRDYAIAAQEFENLQTEKSRMQTNPELMQARAATIDAAIEEARQRKESLASRREDLNVTAMFDGRVQDMDVSIIAGQTIPPERLLMRIVNPQQHTITAYVTEDDIGRLQGGAAAYFTAGHSPFLRVPLRVENVASVDSDVLDWPELAALNGGPIPAEPSGDPLQPDTLVPRQSLYRVVLVPEHGQHFNFVTPGRVEIEGERTIPILNFGQRLVALAIRELNFGS